jgi:ribosomal protein L29
MKAKEIKTMSKKDIELKISELKKEMIKHNAQVSSGSQIKSPALIKQTKKNIARLMHALNEKEE